jgi:hypothetical protein
LSKERDVKIPACDIVLPGPNHDADLSGRHEAHFSAGLEIGKRVQSDLLRGNLPDNGKVRADALVARRSVPAEDGSLGLEATFYPRT